VKQRLAILAATTALVALVLPAVVAAADTLVVAGRDIPGHGTLLVATSNQMTVYTFDKDVAGSGASACTGGCLDKWPALTVTAGDTPTGGPGVTGTLGTIVRTDSGATQVTYGGLPLYFFVGDKAPGDANGIYTNWRAIVLVAAVPSPTPPPTAAPTAAPTDTATGGSEAATPPPTSTAPGGGDTPPGVPFAALLIVGVAALGSLAAIRRRVVVRR
jgi:predicted lipoprotein with Yx(FWY)xxD motif